MKNRRRGFVAATSVLAAALILGPWWIYRLLVLADVSWPSSNPGLAPNGRPASILDPQYAAFGGELVPDITPMKGWPQRPVTEAWSRVRFGYVTLGWRVRSETSEMCRVTRAAGAQGPYVPVGNAFSVAPGAPVVFRDATVQPRTQYLYHVDRRLPGGWETVAALGATTPAVAVGILEVDSHPLLRLSVIEVEMDTAGAATLDVLDARGDRVRRLFSGFVADGAYQVAWDWNDSRGYWVRAGRYVLRLQAEGMEVRQELSVW